MKIDKVIKVQSLRKMGENMKKGEKNKVQWEESAYQISIKSNENWQSYKGPKFAKNGRKYEKMWKIAVFAW